MRHLKISDCHSLNLPIKNRAYIMVARVHHADRPNLKKTRFEKLKLEMSDSSAHEDAQKTAKRALWASSVFYVLIAFEFFYMASPFTTYFYTVYRPGLDWLQGSSVNQAPQNHA
tara:strand:+ start:169 stop:510 length:342 start_codon:yes stop_codon:yes gene_type:complete